MFKVLLLGGSHSELPIIHRAKEENFFIISTGTNRDGIGHKYADMFIDSDYSNKELILEIAKRENIDAIVAGCNDFAAITAAYVSEKMCLKGHDTYQNTLVLNNKNDFRQLASELDIYHPCFIKLYKNDYECGDLSGILKRLNANFPLIVKPVDLTGGKGVMVCKSLSELSIAIKHAFAVTREDYILIEDFIVGSNHGFSTYIQNGRIKFYFVDNEQYYINKYAVSGASSTCGMSSSVLSYLVASCEKIAQKLGLIDGIFHLQFILTDYNKPYIIEATRRPPGDLYINLVKYATGFDYPYAILMSQVGQPLNVTNYISCNKNIARHCIMTDRNGVVDDIVIDVSVQDRIIDSIVWAKCGDIIDNYLTYKAGIIFLSFETESEMNDTIQHLNELIYIKLKEC